MAALKYAFLRGFKTSISLEPYLPDPRAVVSEVDQYVTDTIWIGLMNQIKQRLSQNGHSSLVGSDELKSLESLYAKRYVQKLYNEFKNNPKVKWKDSIKKMLKL